MTEIFLIEKIFYRKFFLTKNFLIQTFFIEKKIVIKINKSYDKISFGNESKIFSLQKKKKKILSTKLNKIHALMTPDLLSSPS